MITRCGFKLKALCCNSSGDAGAVSFSPSVISQLVFQTAVKLTGAFHKYLRRLVPSLSTPWIGLLCRVDFPHFFRREEGS